ncbi:membrane-bound metal-dependent hydrolase [Gracilibacillus halophilus YIM-C55.5]|uniref:Membrane-bound metal-dependent hydrolase n=1 Tax=Gracilibacillus halophilus YIM-C55.5 TaxID=1308866 RepID=N4WHV4_9BACI|nr:metal-dependent hydrolase [Gracilibacillus halophilus]ENH95757.1 membrane-bound metal-dependent hydrolase [Gracilibacillus halophilus YIM-C55.5]
MDTATHIAMGVALSGIATLDPVVQQDSTMFTAVIIGTIIGSHAPDFDTILKLRNNAAYIRHHRGITHSLPAIILWGIAIASFIYLFIPEVNFLHLWLWTGIAVILHVFVDIFNAYGTQAYRPFTKRWVAYGFISTFDPYIFTLHVIGGIAWMLGAHPGYTWIVIYTIITLYYMKRYIDKREIVKKLEQHFSEIEQITTYPTTKQNIWRVAVMTSSEYYVGEVDNGHIHILDRYRRVPLPDHPLTKKAKEDKNVSAFLSFSPIYRWEMHPYDDFTEIRFVDLRYRNDGHYPFVAVVQIDDNLHIMNSYTGWVFSEEKLQDKLDIDGQVSST